MLHFVSSGSHWSGVNLDGAGGCNVGVLAREAFTFEWTRDDEDW